MTEEWVLPQNNRYTLYLYGSIKYTIFQLPDKPFTNLITSILLRSENCFSLNEKEQVVIKFL